MTIITGLFVDLNATLGSWANGATIYDGVFDSMSFSNSATSSSNYAVGRGTNIESIVGERPTIVRVRHFGGITTGSIINEIFTQGLSESLGNSIITNDPFPYNVSSWTSLTIPSGGWTWNNIINLESKLYLENNTGSGFVGYVEIEVTSEEIIPNETSIDVILKSSTNQVIELKSETNKNHNLKSSTNKNYNIKSSTNEVIKLKSSTNKEIILK